MKPTILKARIHFHTLASTVAATGGLSAPSKMPGDSWSIPARRCQVGSLLAKRPGTPCASCYALRGRYVFSNVREALERRFQAWSRDPQAWQLAMVAAISYRADAFRKRHGADSRYPFRWFDSGDLQSVDMLESIAGIAEALPRVDFWLPTQERGILSQFLQTRPLPHNLTVRISSAQVDKAERMERWKRAPGAGHVVSSMVTTDPATRPADAFLCPAPDQGNACGNCRACWQGAQHPLVAYRAH